MADFQRRCSKLGDQFVLTTRNPHKSRLLRCVQSLVLVTGLLAGVLLTAAVVKPGVAAANASVWSIAPSSNPGSLDFLGDPTCSAPNDCIAVGYYENGSSEYQTLVESWNGTTWSVVPSPNEGTGYNMLNGIYCLNSSNCIAVGDYMSGSAYQTLVETWNGSSWTIVSSPDKGSNYNYLFDVSCVDVNECQAAGYYEKGSNYQTLIETYDGSGWSVMPTPDEGTGDNLLYSISCSDASDCVAAGNWNTGSQYHALLETYDGSSWAITPSPNEGASESILGGVSCTSSTYCLAVGYDYNGSVYRTLANSWNGSTWSLDTTPNDGTLGSDLTGVDCLSQVECVAVGDYYTSGSDTNTLVEVLNGTSWKITPSSDPAGADNNELTGVSCASINSCQTTGYTQVGTTYETLAENGNSGPIAYVVNSGDGTVTPIDLATGVTETPIPVGADPTSIAITPDGRTAYVTNYGSSCPGSCTVTPIDLSTDTAEQPITVDNGANSVAVTPDGAMAFDVDAASSTGNIYPIDVATNTAGTAIATNANPYAVAISPNGSTAYVSNPPVTSIEPSEVLPVNVTNDSVGSPITVGGTNSDASGLAITPDGTTLYVADSGSESIVPVDLSTQTAGSPISVGTDPVAVAVTPSGTTAFAVVAGSNSVVPIDTASETAGTPIQVGDSPSAAAVNPDGSTLYVTNSADDTVTPIDISTDEAGTPIDVGADPTAIAISPDQSPEASMSVTPAPSGSATLFDASESIAPSSQIVSYAWSFGDGDTETTSTPTTTHIYASSGNYTATVTETDAAGTSTAQVFTGQTVSNNGGQQAVDSQSFEVIPCEANSTCSGTVSDASQSTTLTGTSSTDATLQISIGQQTVSCGYQAPATEQVTTYSTTTFTASSLAATMTINGDTDTTGFNVCYSSTTPFRDRGGTSVTTGHLPSCQEVSDVAPCIASVAVTNGNLVATLSVPPGDPRFWGPTVLASFSPTKGSVGTRVTVVGGPWAGTSQVDFDGVPTQFKLSKSNTKLTALVPSGATSGPITIVTADGDATSKTNFKVTKG
jgi:YVTN family beta-propeller protein